MNKRIGTRGGGINYEGMGCGRGGAKGKVGAVLGIGMMGEEGKGAPHSQGC